jgi:hypothetical protein
MKKLLFFSAVLSIQLLLTPTLLQAEASVDDVEKQLKALGDHVNALLDRTDEVYWQFKPTGQAHSIGEEMEHLSLAHQDLQGVFARALKQGEQAEKAKNLSGKEEFLRERMLDPENKAENYKVKNILQSKAEVAEYFNKAHRKALEVIRAVPDPSLYVFKHPSPTYGELTGLQWLYYLVYHGERHAIWLDKMLNHPEFPGAKSGS